MQRKVIVNKKEYTMPKMSIDTYMDYLELSEQIDAKKRYTKQDIEAMVLFVCKAYGDQFTAVGNGLDAAGIIMEFQFIDVGVGEELARRMEKIQKNFQSGK